MRATVKLQLGRLDTAAQRAFRRTVSGLERRLPAAHRDTQWQWKGRTRRSNGSVVGSPRNIWDTGELARSQQPAVYPDPHTAVIGWTTKHAAATYLGAVFRNRAASLPGRNLPLNVLKTGRWAEVMQRELARELG